MGFLIIIAAIVILLVVIIGVWYARKTPAPAQVEAPLPTLPVVPVNPFKIGDMVRYEWLPPASASDICAPSSGKSVAYGIIKKVDGEKVAVRWMIVKNPSPRPGLTPAQCCWDRSFVTDPNAVAWNAIYWGDENNNPTYAHGLKSIFASYKDLTKIEGEFWPQDASC